MGYRLDHLLTQSLTKLHDTLLMTGRTKVPALAGEGQKIFVTAVCAFDTGKSIVEVATVKIPVNHAGDIRPKEAILPLKPFLIDLLKCFKMVPNTLIIKIMDVPIVSHCLQVVHFGLEFTGRYG